MPKFEPVATRFWRKVNQAHPGCWLWIGRKTWNGYGQFDRSHSEIVLAHRVAYELANGSIPDGMNICHRCDVRDCVNPAHLFAGSQSENMKDAFRKGRIRRDGIYNPRHHSHRKQATECHAS